MQAHELRVVEEKKELDEKLDKLNKFISESEIFARMDIVDAEMLEDQADIMAQYSAILGSRISRFAE